MRKKRVQETEAQRNVRFEKEAQRRIDDAAAEAEAVDVMVNRSIKLHGP